MKFFLETYACWYNLLTAYPVVICQFNSRSGSSEAPQKVRPGAVRQLKTTGLESDSSSPSNQLRTPKDRTPKAIDRRSPRSPVTEKKRPSRISELESQISQLHEELSKAKDQLNLSESWKKEALQDAEESKKQLLAISTKLEESQKQLQELSISEEARGVEIQKISEERDRAWQSELEAIQHQHLVDSAALGSALSEIQQLKVQLEMVAESEATQNKHAESADLELQTLRSNLMDTLSLVENMKNQLRDSKDSEPRPRRWLVKLYCNWKLQRNLWRHSDQMAQELLKPITPLLQS
ncbi:hypothetical protein GH714_003211 [Hevea brasiliensis]|uniref:Uncharacterized protein n=1 Tax=Hevea brasiliensis TaxID=3981 RepID=A0A6A6NBI1_HEVBR|nr:hypothetical protein GH714_003211 [Hevea brasiliensis]